MSNVATQLTYNPITITSQDDDTVTFTITNPFGSDITALYYQYAAADSGNTKCYAETPLTSCPEPIEVTAHCMHTVDSSVAVVDLWFVDPLAVDISDGGVVPDCCLPEEENANVPTVLFTFKIFCKSKCADNVSTRRLDNGLDNVKSAVEFQQSAMDEGVVFNKSRNSKGPYCASVDYPCGEDAGFVHVCHYSSRDGYQTFCVPESDSDVIAYVPKDYCGPCIGGYRASSH